MGQTSFIRKNFRVDEKTFSKVRSIIELWHGRPVAVLIRLVYDAGLGNISESTLQRIARCQTYQEYRELAAEARKTRPARREAEDEMTDEERDEAVAVNEAGDADRADGHDPGEGGAAGAGPGGNGRGRAEDPQSLLRGA